MKIIKKIITLQILLTLSVSIFGCSLFKSDPEINASIKNQDLIFDFADQDVILLAYRINSLEHFEEDGLAYKNILKYQDYDGFREIVIGDYKNNNILDNHAYYLLVTKEGTKFQTLGFCIKNELILIQKNKKDDQGFVSKCHNFNSK